MKGFKPTGYGPTMGFEFPASMGFTGSTGGVTNVAPYVRRRPFANGGFVRQDHPRMKSDMIGDQGSAMVRRSKPTTQLDAESGGRTGLRPGFKDGGRNWIKGAIKKPGALHRALGVPEGKKIPAKKLNKAAHSDNPTMRRRANLAKTLKRMHKAEGGRVIREEGYAPRRMGAYTFRESVRSIPSALKEAFRYASEKAGKRSSGIAKKGAETISGRQRQIDRYVDSASTGFSEYSMGGAAKKRMGYTDGGSVDAQRRLRVLKAMHDNPREFADMFGKEMTDREIRAFAQERADVHTSPNHRVNLKKTRTVKPHGLYAKGGSVHSDLSRDRPEMRRIAEKVVGEHVRYPAPKGHKGLKKSS